MPIIEMSSADAVNTRKTNKIASWGSRSVVNRVEPVTKPGFAVPFQMKPGEKIFTVGSCFARHVEQALIKRGFEIPMLDLFKPAKGIALLFQKGKESTVNTGVINNFGTPSIYNEFAWALEEEKFIPEDHFVEVRNGQFVDMHLIPSVRPTDWETAVKRRKAITAAYRSFMECRVVIITLGLVEVWFDSKTGYYLNSSPRPTMIKNEPDRFKLHVLSFQEAYSYLEKTIELIKQHGLDDVKVVVTVSPVPLAVTHRDDDVIVANTYSKSVLRVVADTITAKYDFVTYYPSYESVSISDRKIAWKDDFVHVTDEIVSLNINRMVDAFVEAPYSMSDHHEAFETGGIVMAVERAVQVRDGSVSHAEAFFTEFGEYSKQSDSFAMEHAQFLMSQKQFDQALEVIENAPDQSLDSNLILKAEILFELKKYDEAVKAVDEVVSKNNKGFAIWNLYMKISCATDNPEIVLATLRKWSKTAPRQEARANGLVGDWFIQRGDNKKAFKYFEKGTALNPEDAYVKIKYASALFATGKVQEAREQAASVIPRNPTETVLIDRLIDKIGREEVSKITPAPDAKPKRGLFGFLKLKSG